MAGMTSYSSFGQRTPVNNYINPTEELPTDPYELENADTSLGGTNPYGFGFQQMRGQMAIQPLKSGAPTNGPIVTTPGAPAYQTPWWQQDLSKTNGITTVNGVTYNQNAVPGGRRDTTYTFADGRVGHMAGPGQRLAADGRSYVSGGFGGFQQLMQRIKQYQGNGGGFRGFQNRGNDRRSMTGYANEEYYRG